jgi:protein kinase-like protein
MGSLLLVPGLDTRLARLLLERQRVEYPTLHAALTKVRALRQSSPHTLALELVELGLVDASDLEATIAEFLGDDPQNPRRWRVGETVSGLEILGSLGAGGMGEVFLARDSETGGEVAVKTLRIDEDEGLLVRFQREAEAQARVDAHPNVVRIHRSGMARGRAFLVMDAVRGGDLDQRLASGPLEPRAAARLVRDLALGLVYAHGCGVLHRDLKPANVLFDERGTPRLADFGLARLLEAEALTQTGEILGTPSYMAPEQAKSGTQDERTDVYGLGGILYAALSGRPPFEGGSVYALLEQVISASPPDPRTRAPQVPAELAELCLRCLEKSPEDRFASALELSAALDAFLEGRSQRGASGARWLVAGAAGLALFGALGAWAAFSEPTPRVSPTPVEAAVIPEASRPPTSEEVRAEVEGAGPGPRGALLAADYLARGLGPRPYLQARAAEPILRVRIPQVSGGVPIAQDRLIAWRAAKEFEEIPLAFLVDTTTREVIRSWEERLLSLSPSGARVAFLSRAGEVRVLESGAWTQLALTKPLQVNGASFGGEDDLWIVGRAGLSRLRLSPPGEPQLIWRLPPGQDAAMVQPLPSGDILVGSGRSGRGWTGLRSISPTGEVRWESPLEGLFDGKPRALRVSPDGRWALFGTASGQIALFATAAEPGGTREPTHNYRRPTRSEEPIARTIAPRAHRTSVVSLTWISNDEFLSVDARPAAFHLWRREGECLATDLAQDFAPERVTVGPDGRFLYVASEQESLLRGVLRSSLLPD